MYIYIYYKTFVLYDFGEVVFFQHLCSLCCICPRNLTHGLNLPLSSVMLAIYPHPLLWSSSQLGRVLLADFDIQYFLWHTGILYTVLARVPFPIVIPSPFECFVFGQSRTMTTVTVCGIPPANICQSFNISSHHPTGRGIRCCRA